MSDKEYFTVVFKGDVGALAFNPLTWDGTAFGPVEAVARGDVLSRRDDEYWSLDETASMHSDGEHKALADLAAVTLERDTATKALADLLDRYVSLANSGDCGFWDCEDEDEVIQARAVLARRAPSRPSCDGPSSTAYDQSGYAKEPGQ